MTDGSAATNRSTMADYVGLLHRRVARVSLAIFHGQPDSYTVLSRKHKWILKWRSTPLMQFVAFLTSGSCHKSGMETHWSVFYDGNRTRIQRWIEKEDPHPSSSSAERES